MTIKKGDNVKVLSGRDRNKTGKVVQVLHLADRGTYVVVEGVNQLKKHLRRAKNNQAGQVIELPSPLPVSKVMLISPKTNKPTRLAKASKEIIA